MSQIAHGHPEGRTFDSGVFITSPTHSSSHAASTSDYQSTRTTREAVMAVSAAAAVAATVLPLENWRTVMPPDTVHEKVVRQRCTPPRGTLQQSESEEQHVADSCSRSWLETRPVDLCKRWWMSAERCCNFRLRLRGKGRPRREM